MPSKTHKITSVKSPKTSTIKKVLLYGAAATGLILAGAFVFASTLSDDEVVEDNAE